MTALAHQLPQPYTPARAPRLVLVPPYEAPARPTTADVPFKPVFWRRRLAAAVVLTTLVVGAWSLAGQAIGLVSSQSAASPATTTGLVGVSPATQSAPLQWTVRPGDTLWTIARSVKPSGDIRPVLNPLIKQYSGEPLQVGQTINIPAFKS